MISLLTNSIVPTKTVDPRVARRGILASHLPHFTGSEKMHHHVFGRYTFTDGVAFLAQTAQAYWLLDLIGSYQARLARMESAFNPGVKGIPFQIWFLRTDLENSTARATCHEDWSETVPSRYPAIILQKIEATDFPLAEIKLYLSDGVLCLPSER